MIISGQLAGDMIPVVSKEAEIPGTFCNAKYHQNNPNRVKHLQQEVGLVIFCIFKCEYSSLMFGLQIVSK